MPHPRALPTALNSTLNQGCSSHRCLLSLLDTLHPNFFLPLGPGPSCVQTPRSLKGSPLLQISRPLLKCHIPERPSLATFPTPLSHCSMSLHIFQSEIEIHIWFLLIVCLGHKEVRGESLPSAQDSV